MRGSSLSKPENLELLRPFVVTSWHGGGTGGMDPAVKAVWDKSDVPKNTNVFMFVLDSQGALVHGFQGLPRGRDHDHFRTEFGKAAARLKIPEAKPARENLPDVGRGVRLFIRTDRTRAPIVEAAAEDWAALAYPEAAREVDPGAFKKWLFHLYPPAIRTADQSKPFQAVSGALKLRPAGTGAKARYAILSGEFRLAKGADTDSAFEGKLEAVVTYAPDQAEARSVRGVVEGTYLYRQRGEQSIKLSAAIESRPE